MTQVYEHVRVLDFTQLEQGPAGTQVLADFGAEVIKVERIDVGEIGREHLPRIKGMSPHWAANNRNKLSISINLKHPDGLEIVQRLTKTADIVASNFRPGVMERLGLGYPELSVINPRIICAYASGYGQDGPYRDRRGQDLVAQALGGVMALTGSGDGPPTPVGTFAVDYVAAMHFAQGMMLALAAREHTGRGQVVDCSLLNSAVAMHLQEATTYLNTGRLYPRPNHGIAHSHNTVLYARYQTMEGAWLVLVGEFYIDKPWQRVARALELGDSVIHDPRFQTISSLLEHEDAAHTLLTEGFAKYTCRDAIERLENEDVLAAPVNDYPTLFTDPQVLSNEMVLETSHPAVGPIRLVGNPVKLSDTAGRLRTPPPTVGQHNELLLRQLGYSSADIASLQKAGAVGSENRRAIAGAAPSW